MTSQCAGGYVSHEPAMEAAMTSVAAKNLADARASIQRAQERRQRCPYCGVRPMARGSCDSPGCREEHAADMDADRRTVELLERTRGLR